MRYPRPIRGPRAMYSDRSLRFHVTVHLHPKHDHLGPALATNIWTSLLEHRTSARVRLFAACLMPDHLHMLVAPGEDDVIRFIGAWKAWTTRLSWGLGNVNALWQPGMWDRTIRDTRDFDATITYILDNPVKAGLVEQPEQWAHSWAYWYDDDP